MKVLHGDGLAEQTLQRIRLNTRSTLQKTLYVFRLVCLIQSLT